jgi:agmatinase
MCHLRGSWFFSTTMLLSLFVVLLDISATIRAHDHFAEQLAFKEPAEATWLEKYGPQIDQPFSGPLSFGHLPYTRCLEHEEPFDIAILGMPFDTAVTYRSGARFGPYGIRSGSRRQRQDRGYTMSWRIDPFAEGIKIIDCGDVNLTKSSSLGMTNIASLRFPYHPSTMLLPLTRWRWRILRF